jgi:hypothetical protein
MKRKPNPLRRRWHQPRLENLEPRLVPANVDVLSYHYDSFLSGENSQETILHPGPVEDPTTVNAINFGKLFTQAVDGQVYAQPLYKANLTIPGQGTHNVAFVATENDSVYAFDADTNTGASAGPLWKASLIDPTHGITPMPSEDVSEINVVPELGITGTPVIDGSTNTLYVVTCTKEVVGTVAHYRQRLHALDLATGAEKFGGPSIIGDSVPNGDGTFTETSTVVVNGAGDETDGMGHIRFSAARQLQRPALQLAGGVVYVAWASHGDIRPYHGWVIGLDASTLQPVKWFNTSPNAGGAGVWQSGGGITADAQGNLYFGIGNAFSGPNSANDPAHGNYTEAVLKLSTTGQLTVADYFIPNDWQTLDDQDADLGSGGVMLLPDFVGSTAHPHLMVETGKSGKIYLIDRDDLGKNVPPPGPDRVVQIVTAGQRGVWGNPAFFKVNATTGIIYYHGQGDFLKGYTITNGHIDDTPADILNSLIPAGYPGTQPTVSANGTSSGIVWEMQVDQYIASGPAVLRAFNATDLTQELYGSDQAGQRDQFGTAVRFTVPIVTNGHVLVASANSFAVFGLFPPANAVPGPCTNLQGSLQSTTRGPQIRLTWTNPAPNPGADPTGIKILRSTDGSNYTLVGFVDRNTTTFSDPGPFVTGLRYYYGLIANNQQGDSVPSSIINVLVPVAPAVLTVSGTAASSISLTWTAVAGDHYDIERSTDGTNFTRVATVPAVQTSYTDAGLAAGAYAYRIHAFNVNPPAESLSNVRGTWVGPVIDHGSSFTTGFDLTTNGNALVSPTEQLLRLTGANNQTGSAFSNTPVSVAKFTATFQVFLHEGTEPNFADGFTFVLQPNAPTALGQGGAGLGYAGIGHGVAVKFSTFQHPGDPSSSSIGLVLNGANPAGGTSTVPSGVLLNSQDRKQIDLTYDGTTLTVKITDIPRSLSFTTSFPVNIPQVLGSDTAYVGFTAATGSSDYWQLQDVLNWKFTSQAVLPGTPANLRETAHASSAIDLAWDARSFNETGFQVERSLDGTNFTRIATVTTPGFEDNGLPVGTYYYRVKALNAQGSSSYSNVVTATLPGALLTQDQDIGTSGDPAFPGSATFFNGTYTVSASGTDIGNPNDHFHFVYMPVLGDGEIIARVASETLGAGFAKAGVMFRQDLTPTSPNAFTLQYPAGAGDPNGPALQWRPNSGDLTFNDPSPNDTATPPVWLRLVRSAFTFSGYWARDNGDGTHGPWNLLGSETVDMTANAYVGLAFNSESNLLSFLGTATFDHVQFLPAVAQASHLEVSKPTGPNIPGQPVTITVTALDPYNNPVTGYRGMVHFTGTDPQAVLPADYTFTAADNGVHTFRVTLWTAGRQAVNVADTMTAIVRGGTQVPAVDNPPPVVAVDYSAGFADHVALTANGSAAFPGSGSPLGIFGAHQDVNIPFGREPSGTATYNSSTATYSLTAAGSGFQNTADQFHYAYQLLNGDGEIVARLASETALDYFTEAGLLIRDNLSPGSPTAFMGEYGVGGDHNSPVFKARPGQNAPLMIFDTQTGTQAPPVWLRLVRSGNSFTGYWAHDNGDGTHGPWQQLDMETVPMGATVFVGLAVASNRTFEVATATFDHVSVTTSGSPPVPARLTDPTPGQAGSVFTTSRVGVASFTTSFTFQLRSLADPVGNGLTFIIHNDPRGPAALATAAGGLGYGGNGGIVNSVAIKFDSFKPSGNHSSTGLYFNGHFPANDNGPPDVVVDLAGTGIDFAAAARATPAHSFRVDLGYDGTTLTETITDLTTHATKTVTYTVDIVAAVGGPAAYVGFAGDAGGPNVQDVQSWTGQFKASGPATHLAVSVFPTATTAGAPLTATVTLLDRNNNQAFGYTGTMHFTSSDAQAGLPANYTFTAADGGQHVFTVMLKTAGTQSVTATDTVIPSVTGTQSGIMVSPGPVSVLAVTGFPSAIVAGTSGMFTVTSQDAYGNLITGYRGTAHFTSSDGQAMLPANYTFTAADNGVHTFSATLKTAGSQTITATDTVIGTITGSQSGIMVNAAAASTLMAAGFPSPTTAGVPGTFTVTLKDIYGNIATGYRGTVRLTSSDGQAGLPAPYTFAAADNGVHTFNVTLKTVGTQSLTATDTADAALTASQTGIVVRPGAASVLLVGGFPSPVTAGVSGMVTVTAQDAYGNVATGYTGTVQFISTDPQAALPDDYTFQPGDNGVHTFGAALKTSGTRTLTATDTMTGTITGTQTGITVNPAAADHLDLTAPASVSKNTPFPLTVTARDPFNNVATPYTGTIHFTSTDPRAGLPPDYTFVPGDAGRQTFSVTLGTAGTQTITAADTVTTTISGSATVNVARQLFYPPADTAVGANPQAVAVGDFNGDGIPDLAVANTGDNTITILLGQGDGTFINAGTLATDAAPVSIAVADLNGDGLLDLVVANRDGGTLTIFLGNGDGTFQPPQSIALGVSPTSVAVADFNGDGLPDLVIADPADGQVGVLLGNGDGTFQAPVFSPAGGDAVFVAVADFNGDGLPDVVTANSDSKTISILLGNGDGTFQPATTYLVDQLPVSVAIGDFNSDGLFDLVIANSGSNDVSILLGNGDGTFQPAQNITVGANPLAVVVGDFNGDGLPDLAVANQGDNTVNVLLGNGDGTFQAALNFAVSTGPAAVAAADFNGDGAADLVTANSSANTVSVLLNAGDWPTIPGPSAAHGKGRLGRSASAALSRARPEGIIIPSLLPRLPTPSMSAPESFRSNEQTALLDCVFTETGATVLATAGATPPGTPASRWADTPVDDAILAPWLLWF